jgi:hypothetical protein
MRDGEPHEAGRNDQPRCPKRTTSNNLRIYPVYTLFRNKFPRPAGQGASRQVYGLLGISGSQTGGQGVVDISIPELVQSGGTLANTSWPLNIPQSGKQTEYKLNVPCLN